MGATTFFTHAVGASVGEAYNAATHHARFEHGHGGYTGTIAEKGGYTVVVLPPRVTAHAFQAHLHGAEWALCERNDRTSGRDLHTRATAKDRADWAWMVKHFGEGEAIRLIGAYNDKWGPALAVLLRGRERELARIYWGVKKGSPAKAYGFMGYASC